MSDCIDCVALATLCRRCQTSNGVGLEDAADLRIAELETLLTQRQTTIIALARERDSWKERADQLERRIARSETEAASLLAQAQAAARDRIHELEDELLAKATSLAHAVAELGAEQTAHRDVCRERAALREALGIADQYLQSAIPTDSDGLIDREMDGDRHRVLREIAAVLAPAEKGGAD